METPTEFNEFKQTGLMVREQAEAIQIVDQLSYNYAVEGLKTTTEREKKVIAFFATAKQKAFDAHKAVCALEKEALTEYQTAKRMYASAIGAWDKEQQRKEDEERRRLEAEERKRLADEALAEAVSAQEDGASEAEIEAILEAPRAMPKVVPLPSYQRASGVRTVTYYSAELVSLERLVAAAYANKLFLPYLMANMPVANASARSQKEMFDIPGFRLKKSTNASSSGR